MGLIIVCSDREVVLEGRVNPGYFFWLDELVKLVDHYCRGKKLDVKELRNILCWMDRSGIRFMGCTSDKCAKFETPNYTDLNYYSG